MPDTNASDGDRETIVWICLSFIAGIILFLSFLRGRGRLAGLEVGSRNAY